MAHSVINDATLSCVPGEEGVGEIAASVADELQECRCLDISRVVVEATCDSQSRLAAPVDRVSRSTRSKLRTSKNMRKQIPSKRRRFVQADQRRINCLARIV